MHPADVAAVADALCEGRVGGKVLHGLVQVHRSRVLDVVVEDPVRRVVQESEKRRRGARETDDLWRGCTGKKLLTIV